MSEEKTTNDVLQHITNLIMETKNSDDILKLATAMKEVCLATTYYFYEAVEE